MEYLIVNSLGLVFDIIGVLVIWKYGLPLPVRKGGSRYRLMDETNDDETFKAKKYNKRAKWGIRMLVLGFIFQLCSNFLPSR